MLVISNTKLGNSNIKMQIFFKFFVIIKIWSSI